MALNQLVKYIFLICVIGSVILLSLELQKYSEKKRYNQAIAAKDYAKAAPLLGDLGRFANAYGEQLSGNVDTARTVYGSIGQKKDRTLKSHALYNLGNSYMQQVASIDIEKDSDLAYPLIELAKTSYRAALSLDSENWDARRNLEQALILLPDSNPRVPMEVQGRRGAVRTVISADSEKNLP